MTTTTWNPIEQLESLADVLTEWTRSRDRLTTAEISVIYRQHSTEKLRRWIESNVSQDEADCLYRVLHDPLTNLTRWEQQTESGTWWQSDGDADDAYRSEMEMLERYVESLRLLAGRIRPKLGTTAARHDDEPSPLSTLIGDQLRVFNYIKQKSQVRADGSRVWVATGAINRDLKLKNGYVHKLYAKKLRHCDVESCNAGYCYVPLRGVALG